MSEPKHNILFPIETINRELDFRLALAAKFVTPSRRIFIGSMRRINRMISGLEGGLYVGKHIFYRPSDYLRFYRQLRKRNFALIYIHEEGAIFSGGEEAWRQRLGHTHDLDLIHLQSGDWLCNWGEFQTRYYRAKMPLMAEYIRTTGHPRFDLYKPHYRPYYQKDVDELRQRFGRYLLVNTNLALPNSSRGLDFMFHPKSGYVPEDAERRLSFVHRWAHNHRILSGMVSLVHRLSIEFPHRNIVVRPHPVENVDFYRTVFSGVPNIFIELSGPVGPWIMAADALIHDGCTTAVETYLAEKPIINYKSVDNPEYDLKVPNELGLKCTTEEQVIDAVRDLDDRPGMFRMHEATPLCHDLMHNLDADSFAPLLDVMEKALAQTGRPSSRQSLYTVTLRERLWQLRESPKVLMTPLSARRIGHMADRQKFYGFDAEVIRRKIEALQTLLQKQIACHRISEHLLVIETG